MSTLWGLGFRAYGFAFRVWGFPEIAIPMQTTAQKVVRIYGLVAKA